MWTVLIWIFHVCTYHICMYLCMYACVPCMHYECMYTVKDGMTIDSENKILLCLTTLLLKRLCIRSSWLYSFGLALAVGHHKRPWAEITLFHTSLSFLLGKILCNSAILLGEEPKETSAATSGRVAVVKVFICVFGHSSCWLQGCQPSCTKLKNVPGCYC